MKFNFKFLFAGVAIIPLSVGAMTFSSFDKPQLISPRGGEELALPYIIDEIAPDGHLVKEYSGTTANIDPIKIASDIGAKPFVEDKFTAFPDIKMGIGSKITLYRAPVFTVVDGKKNITVRSWAKTVGGVLTDGKVQSLGADDKINFATDTRTELEMEIHIARVARTNVVESENINFSIVKKENPSLEKGTKSVLQKGVLGSRAKTYLVIREDGEEVSKTLIKSEVTQVPVSEIDEIGTKVVVYGSGKASWYINTSNMIGACNILPKGTKVHVVNLANGKSVDITTSGGGIQTPGRILDLSTSAFTALGASLGQGIISNVRVEKYYPSTD
ncbi:hypothetical protein COT78_00645 [Candidatus Berkelbacteria bacterium CG10_big_fil_rev_8_21_14_0_10_43_13]|uniref:G5 domain-containing protein n=1 Tax=Candidatus Berkelbacteria bacterium CG10_big_fil_rev_8_21_14_0_10_43_13 TaxID=1974514 RepID=A0A2H0W9D7_9BACT|nr:MAG: hypothetical protein COT78_00645 [Candidatus Berkelbacteria bacterium CG10_big_fil_rev_8_21_14_0_10_43_13]